jgi:hypothetical protein
VSWQPTQVLFPDAEQVMCDATRAVLTGDLQPGYIGRKVPATITTAVVWNRIGGASDGTFDHPLMMCRCWAPTDTAVNALAADLAARLPGIVDGGPVVRLDPTSGPTDLGTEASPMRQLLFDVTTRGTQL